MIRHVERLLLLSLAVFAAAFALRRAFFWDIKPPSFDYTPPQNGALEAAFLLLSIENVAAIVAAIAIVFVAAMWWKAHTKQPEGRQ
jgi:nitrogen fixation-related uncharacterized protein